MFSEEQKLTYIKRSCLVPETADRYLDRPRGSRRAEKLERCILWTLPPRAQIYRLNYPCWPSGAIPKYKTIDGAIERLNRRTLTTIFILLCEQFLFFFEFLYFPSSNSFIRFMRMKLSNCIHLEAWTIKNR